MPYMYEVEIKYLIEDSGKKFKYEYGYYPEADNFRQTFKELLTFHNV